MGSVASKSASMLLEDDDDAAAAAIGAARDKREESFIGFYYCCCWWWCSLYHCWKAEMGRRVERRLWKASYWSKRLREQER